MIRIDDKTWIVASASSFIEGEADRQLRATSKLAGVAWSVGMPDLHPGKGSPVGVAALVDGFVYPHLVGSDIGCGMAVFRIDLDPHFNGDRLAKKARGLDNTWGGDAEAWLLERGVANPTFAESLGTIGGGNHFVEIQEVSESFDDDIGVGSFFLLVHRDHAASANRSCASTRHVMVRRAWWLRATKQRSISLRMTERFFGRSQIEP